MRSLRTVDGAVRPAPTSRLGYRPSLDGVRALAVYSVLAYHSGFSVFRGGFVGVDVFFVLSGYLVTLLLMADLTATDRIDLVEFFSRRVRRILPAAIVVLVVTAVVFAQTAAPARRLDLVGDFRAAFLFFANWHFFSQATDYFATNVDASPVLHFWSLAVEEQFYLVWPLAFALAHRAVARLGRRRWWALRIAVLVAAAASAATALHIAEGNVTRAYYGTDTRAYQLLLGAALALTPQLFRLARRSRLVRTCFPVAALAALAVLTTSAVSLGPVSRGVVVAVVTVALLLGLEAAPDGAVHGFVSARPLAYLGRLSYAIYLWHWPIIVLFTQHRSTTSLERFLIAAPASTALAAVSLTLIERPIRSNVRLRQLARTSIAVGLAMSLLGGVVSSAVLGVSTSTEIRGGEVATGPTGASHPTLLDWRAAKTDFLKRPDCLGQPISRCTVVAGTGRRVLVMGDSHAWAFEPTFTALAKREGWQLTMAVYPTCPWQADLAVLYYYTHDCQLRQADWYDRLLPELDPDLVIVTHQPYDLPDHETPFIIGSSGSLINADTKDYEATLLRITGLALRRLHRPGRQVVVLQPIPVAPRGINPLDCLSKGTPAARCAFRFDYAPTNLERYYTSQSGHDNTTTLDLNRLVCPRLPTCDAVVNDIIVRKDPTHLTATFATSLAPAVGRLLP